MILPTLVEADIHREVCTDILNSSLPHGTQAAFAQEIGTSRQWLHRISQTFTSSMPSEEMARRIAEHLPTTKQNAAAFFEHWQAWHKTHRAISSRIKAIREQTEIDFLLFELIEAHRLMAFSTSPKEVHQQFSYMRSLAELIVNNLQYGLFPLEFVRACTLLSEVYQTIDMPVESLYWAKRGRVLIEHLDVADFRSQHLQFLDYAVNICRYEGEAYRQLMLPRKAYRCFEQSEFYFKLHPQPEYWIPFISLSKLSTLPMKGRLVLADAEALAITIEKKCEQAGFEPWLLSINEHLARAYMAYGNMKKAKKALAGLIDLFDTVGLRQQFMVYRSLARFYWKIGDKTQWEDTLYTALTVSQKAGLISSHNRLLAEFSIAI